MWRSRQIEWDAWRDRLARELDSHPVVYAVVHGICQLFHGTGASHADDACTSASAPALLLPICRARWASTAMRYMPACHSIGLARSKKESGWVTGLDEGGMGWCMLHWATTLSLLVRPACVPSSAPLVIPTSIRRLLSRRSVSLPRSLDAVRHAGELCIGAAPGGGGRLAPHRSHQDRARRYGWRRLAGVCGGIGLCLFVHRR